MGTLKPIGSEKLQGQDKIKRILEIANYKEHLATPTNDIQTESYSIELSDGITYKIIQEKNGYIIKKFVNESSEYIAPMKNRKYYPSYSEAFKRINLMAKEMNTLHENTSGTALFGEQKKFVLKTPKPELPPPSGEPVMGEPEIPSPIMDTPSPDTDAPMEDIPMVDDGGNTDPMGDIGNGEVSFKQIQKLTGKLGQKIREFKTSGEMSSKDIKYVVNSILSALDLTKLEPNDKEEIMARFDFDDMDTDLMDDGAPMDMDVEAEVGVPSEVGEAWADTEPLPEESVEDKDLAFTKEIVDSIFTESKVEKLLSRYFEKTDNEKTFEKKEKLKKLVENKVIVKNIMKEVRDLSETIEQELMSEKFLGKNPRFIFVGKTNKKNLVFESGSKQIKITTEGKIL